MSFVNGVNLLPATGEFTYSTAPYQGLRNLPGALMLPINFYAGDIAPPAVTLTGSTAPVYSTGAPATVMDMAVSLDQLLNPSTGLFPNCKTVSIVCAWFGNSIDLTAANCQIYPSTTYNAGGSFLKWNGTSWVADNWIVSGLSQNSAGIIPISMNGEEFTYGGTPSDASIVECIQHIKTTYPAVRIVFYPFILMDAPGKPWRGQIALGAPDVSTAAQTAVTAFLGAAVPADFSISGGAVHYSGSATDFTYRRMILHYATLCAMAGGVDLFLIGSELRGIETIRGPGWTKDGTAGVSGQVWDYPFVNGTNGLIQIAADVRTVFTANSLTKGANISGTPPLNWISYAADWSSWMGWQHPGANPALPVVDGQWPHLDQLWASSNIDFVCFDNYLPISDWTTDSTGLENLDIANWSAPVPTSWPPSSPPASPNFNGLGLSGTPSIHNKAYLKANIEGGEKFNWVYFDPNNLGRGLDPNGSAMEVSLPEGDRLTQTRSQYYAGQEILGNKQLRWWWNNTHQVLYDDGLGAGEIPRGPVTEWIAHSKSIVFTEYGFPAADKSTNQPNVFFGQDSSLSGSAFWSIWDSADGGGFVPRRDQNLSLLALQAIYEYWFIDGHNVTSPMNMIEPTFCSIWNWDARPFPAFPNLTGVWSDGINWQAGNWLNGKGPFLTPPIPDQPGAIPLPFTFPPLPGLTWSIHKKPSYSTRVASHVSGREVRSPFYAVTLYEFELTIEGLDSAGSFPGLGVNSLQALMGLYMQCQGQFGTFLYVDPSDNTQTALIATTPADGDGTTTTFTLNRALGTGANIETEPVSWITGTPVVHDNGSPAGSFTVNNGNTITFTTAPAAGHAITASCTYAFNCRFLEDNLDFEEFMSGLWRVQSLKFRSVKP